MTTEKQHVCPSLILWKFFGFVKMWLYFQKYMVSHTIYILPLTAEIKLVLISKPRFACLSLVCAKNDVLWNNFSLLVWSCISSLFDIPYSLLLSIMPFVFKISICYLVTAHIDCLRFEQRLKFLKLLFWMLNSRPRHQTIGPLSSFLRAYWWLKANLWLSTSKMEITRLQFIYLSCHHQSNVWWKSQSLKKWVFSYLILVCKCCLLFQY